MLLKISIINSKIITIKKPQSGVSQSTNFSIFFFADWGSFTVLDWRGSFMINKNNYLIIKKNENKNTYSQIFHGQLLHTRS